MVVDAGTVVSIASLVVSVALAVVGALAGSVWATRGRQIDDQGKRLHVIEVTSAEQRGLSASIAADVRELKDDVKELLLRNGGRSRYATPRSDPPPPRKA